jgi:hypothetical protein
MNKTKNNQPAKLRGWLFCDWKSVLIIWDIRYSVMRIRFFLLKLRSPIVEEKG